MSSRNVQSARQANHHNHGAAVMPIEGRIPIAEDLVIWVFPSGEQRPGRIAICAPEPDPSPDVDNDTTWACWYALGGLDKPRRILGSGSLQPLMLALQMIGYELHLFLERGGKVLIPGEEEFGSAPALRSLRVLLRRPSDPYPADPALADLDAEIAAGQP